MPSSFLACSTLTERPAAAGPLDRLSQHGATRKVRGGVVQSEGAFPVPQVHSRLSQADCVQEVRGAGRL
eukprot:7194012-Prymnesium_polylepis.1